MKRTANREIPRIVKFREVDVEGYGSMRSRSTPEGIRRGGWISGELPRKLAQIMRERDDSIVQVIYSYDTPIAWLDAGQWIVPDVRYSQTSGKHQSYLSVLDYELVPWDCSMEEYLRVLNAQMRFVRDGGRLITKPVRTFSDKQLGGGECNCSSPYCQV